MYQVCIADSDKMNRGLPVHSTLTIAQKFNHNEMYPKIVLYKENILIIYLLNKINV
ncbi:Uncharacterised protein [Klebsiella pneumoniae]|uniref:Uncharacterized protein n=1 Tax=Klebsiella pneumoniae TaxID=573 RepID=A0A508ZN85_KLEPN|nr:Uncharacterised protein [Klebsiella pneumoniae]